MKKKSEKQKDLDNLKTELATGLHGHSDHLPGHPPLKRHENSAAKCKKPAANIRSSRNTLAERAGTGTPAEGVLKEPEGHQLHRLHAPPIRCAGEGSHQDCERLFRRSS